MFHIEGQGGLIKLSLPFYLKKKLAFKASLIYSILCYWLCMFALRICFATHEVIIIFASPFN